MSRVSRGNEQFLVGGNNPALDLGIVGGEFHLLAGSLLAAVFADLDAQELHVGADIVPQGSVVLADAAG